PAVGELAIEPLRGLGDLVAGAPEADEVDLPGRDRGGPDDPALVGVLLDRRRPDPRRSDPVAPHHDRPPATPLVQVVGAEWLRVAGAEVEDVADLDRSLDLDRMPARRDIPGLDRADVDLLEGEVSTRRDPDQVGVALVRAGEVPLALDRRILQHVDLRADRADEAGRTELGLDFLRVRLAEVRADRVPKLELLQPMLPPHQPHHPP